MAIVLKHTSVSVGEVSPDAAGEAGRGATRWTNVCAWDGHALEEMDYVQVSSHERVCPFHHPQFQTWCQDTSRRLYRAEDGDEAEVAHLGSIRSTGH